MNQNSEFIPVSNRKTEAQKVEQPVKVGKTKTGSDLDAEKERGAILTAIRDPY